MKHPKNTKKYISVNDLDKTIADLENKIQETNIYLKKYDNQSIKTNTYLPIVLIILAGYIFALILFFIDNFVA